MINERAKNIAMAIYKQINGDVTLDEVVADTLTGAETFLTAIAMHFNKEFNIGGEVTHEGTMWMMVDNLVANLEPREPMPTMMKWYITHYELYCRSTWDIFKMLLDTLSKEDFEKFANDEQFKKEYAELKQLEKRINARLTSDGLGCLEAEIWSEVEPREE